MNLVFFEEAIKHLTKISRVLSQERGNCLLVGLGGSGKQSLTRLSSYVCEMVSNEIEIKKNFKMSDFDKFLIDMMKNIGIKGKSELFLLNETHIL